MNRRDERRSLHRPLPAAVSIIVLALSAGASRAQVHDTTLKGSGTQASPLGVNMPLDLNYNCTGLCSTLPTLQITNSYGAAISATTTAANTTALTGTASTGSGVVGTSSGYSSSGIGVSGVSPNGIGVSGVSTSGIGVYGTGADNGVVGTATNAGTGSVGVQGTAFGIGVQGVTTGGNAGVFGYDQSSGVLGLGVFGVSNHGTGLYVSTNNASSYAAEIVNYGWPNNNGLSVSGSVQVYGNLSKSGGSFKIDHPSDPANKYLSHSFVESPDMMNVYNGNVHTDAAGNATVTLPDWFEALNRDFRYQLTVIGQFAQAMVSSEIVNHSFTIKTDKPNVKVSWQVTGIRQDMWANAHRIPVEEDKPESERGFYMHPELHGQSADKSIPWARNPERMRHMKERAQAIQ